MVNDLWLALEWHTQMLWLAQSHDWCNVGLHLNGFQSYSTYQLQLKRDMCAHAEATQDTNV